MPELQPGERLQLGGSGRGLEPVLLFVSTDPSHSQPGASRKSRGVGRLEVAKRRLIYSLVELGLPLVSKNEDPQNGLAFDFLADPDPADPNSPKVMTGHSDGVITVDIVEADDAEREKRRVSMHEPYRTLLGHFRHEIGHYYWDRLIRGSDRLSRFRERFGDERPMTARHCRHTTNPARPPIGRIALFRPTPAVTLGKTGPRPGRITCISPTRWRPQLSAGS